MKNCITSGPGSLLCAQPVCSNILVEYCIYYFVSVVVMVMDTENKFARAVAHLYKGQTFGVSKVFISFCDTLNIQ